jgi:hypothetical protein
VYYEIERGMTLRDYFAAKAMNAIIPNESGYDFERYITIEDWAKKSYELADAMLKAREL